MMKCNHCNEKIKQEHKFCHKCGEPAGLTCPKCSTWCNTQDIFCPQCGTKLQASENSAATNDKPRDSDIQILHHHAKEQIKHVTLLYVDIKGSTSLIQSMDAEDAANTIKPIISEMINAVYKYDGIVIHTAGDGIAALFGAPKVMSDHAVRACFAAIYMRERIAEINDQIKLRIGINSGEVIFSTIGGHGHLEYDVLGPEVNLATKLEQSAQPGMMRIPVETNSDSGLQANSESGNIRTPVPAHPNSRNQVTPGLSVKHLQSVKHFGFSSAILPSVQA